MNWPQHGSNPQYLYQKMEIPKPEKIIDLSANINPLGPPKGLKKIWMDLFQQINDYPDPYALKLKKMIAEKEKVDIESILIGNGGAEIITLIGRMLAGKNVLIIEPAFSEYEKTCKANDCQIFYQQVQEPDWELHINEITKKLNEMDAVFLCNPNNPTGVFYNYETIYNLLEECKKTETLLIIDEAFYDFIEEYTPVTPLVKDNTNLIILRSMTKMFAIPGLRLGYMIANQAILESVSVYQPQWSVNALAMSVGELCLQDEVFTEQTIKYMNNERQRLFSFFEKEGFTVSPSQVNFYLLKDPEEDLLELFSFLLKKGIVPRHTFNFPGLEGKWLRFAIKSSEENNWLMEVLKEWKQLP